MLGGTTVMPHPLSTTFMVSRGVMPRAGVEDWEYWSMKRGTVTLLAEVVAPPLPPPLPPPLLLGFLGLSSGNLIQHFSLGCCPPQWMHIFWAKVLRASTASGERAERAEEGGGWLLALLAGVDIKSPALMLHLELSGEPVLEGGQGHGGAWGLLCINVLGPQVLLLWP